MSQSARPVADVITPEPVVEGAGVHLRRSIGTRRLDHLDPFLLLDHFESVSPADYEAGFPYHPHQGIETVVIAGYMTHMCCEASIIASATPFCFSAAQKYLTIERTRSAMT